MPIYSGGQVSSAIRQTEELEKKAEADARATEATTIRNTRLAFLKTSTGLQRIAAIKRAVDAASDAEAARSEEHKSELPSQMRNTDTVDWLKKQDTKHKKKQN